MSNDTKIVIVGATSGIGLALTRLFVKKGCRVGIAARRTEELERLRNLALGRIEIQTLDVTQPNSVEHLQALIHRLGGMDIYIHSAGIGQMNVALNEEAELQTVEVNVDGFTRLVAFAFNYFSGVGRGHLVAVSSVAGTRGLGVAASYSASKAYQSTYLQSLRQLMAIRKMKNIVITDIRPGFVATPLLGGLHFPLLMQSDPVAKSIFRAIEQRKHLKIIDWRYRLLVGLWRMIPRFVWERFPLTK